MNATRPVKNPDRVPAFSLRHDPVGPANLPNVTPVAIEGVTMNGSLYKVETTEVRDCVINDTKTRLKFQAGDQIDLATARACGYPVDAPTQTVYDAKGDTVAGTQTVNLGQIAQSGGPDELTGDGTGFALGEVFDGDSGAQILAPGEITDPEAFERAKAAGTITEIDPDSPDATRPVSEETTPLIDPASLRSDSGPTETPAAPGPSQNTADAGPSQNTSRKGGKKNTADSGPSEDAGSDKD